MMLSSGSEIALYTDRQKTIKKNAEDSNVDQNIVFYMT